MTTIRPKPDAAYKMPLREARANLRLAISLFWQVDVFYAWYKFKQTIKRAYREARNDLKDQDKQIAAVLGGAVLILSALLITYLYNLHNQ